MIHFAKGNANDGILLKIIMKSQLISMESSDDGQTCVKPEQRLPYI